MLPYRRTEITVNSTLTMRATDLDMTKLRDLTDFRVDSGALADMGPRRIILSNSTASRLGSTTALSALERTRESGLLRAIGLTRGELGRMVTTEAGLYGVVGSVSGLAIGIPYAWLAIISLGVEWPLQVPVVPVAAVVLALAALTAAAGLLPARRAARVSPVAALHSIQ
ncbi:FtsX-like permease family protein [Lentzea sp. NEAU-D7]|uniref:FtsX-like permease family protein n=1 Tax=Lentzea sp. NEAU-D7 TaxID=2994667 RepID=UPI00224B54CA|nr:ABC transporter permease [Lentzea sp. NEAU-D7]MCX2952955.1 ABC transporter permease [Lentzea sp. NEAU-D7]